MTGESNEVTRRKISWTIPKIIILVFLYTASIYLIYLGLEPFVEEYADKKEYFNLGFLFLIGFFMVAIFKVSKDKHFYLWVCGFGLILYSEVLFWYYEDIVL